MQRFCLIFYEGYIDLAPTVRALINFLSRRGKLDVFISKNKEFSTNFISDNLHVNWQLVDTTDSLLIKFLSSKVTSRILPFRNLIINFQKIYELKKIAKGMGKMHYNQIFVIDATGLFILENSKITFDKKYYLSLEIIDNMREDLSLYEKKLLKFHWEKLSGFQKIIIQDRYRLEVLYCKLEEKKNVLFLPNSAELESLITETDFFRNRYRITTEQQIILVAGMVSNMTLSEDILIVFSNILNDKIKLVIHDRMLNSGFSSLKNKYPKIIFSGQPLRYNEIDTIFRACDIGLVIYNTESSDRNFSVIGLASGKFFNFLKNSKPVIVSNNLGLAHLVIELQCGIVINNIYEIENAIKEINLNYKFYSMNALKAFKDRFVMNEILETILHDN
jgi:glycosyltransferase involved in cell wall biosynthesis